MKKLFAFLLVALFFLGGIAKAQQKVQLVYSDESGTQRINPSFSHPLPVNDSTFSGTSTLFSAETLDDAPTADTSSAIFIGDKSKISFTAVYDETEVGNTVSGALTIEVSPDGSTWYAYDTILDGAGTDAPNASVSFTADGTDFFYLPGDVTAQYARAIITGTNTDTDDTIVFTLVYYWQRE